MQISFMIEAL